MPEGTMFNRLTVLLLLALISLMNGAAAADAPAYRDKPTYNGPTTVDTPVGISLDIDNNLATPLRVRQGQRIYINQIDLRAAIDALVDEGVGGLATRGSASALDWRGIRLSDQSFVDAPNADGTWTRRRFYRHAAWMERASSFDIAQLDALGRVSGPSLQANVGAEGEDQPKNGYFVRRLRAIQWTYDCAAGPSNLRPGGDCASAVRYSEEALLELRYASATPASVKLAPQTTQLRVRWSANPANPAVVPVQQIAAPAFDYGFGMAIEPLTPPQGPAGSYLPGQAITFRVTLSDGSGKRLHPQGSLPSYQEYLAGIDSGLQYYRFFQEPYATYYRRKHREHHLIAAVSGPLQDIQAIRSVADLFVDVDPATGNINSARPERDGFYGAGAEIPSFGALLGGPATWGLPVTDTVTFNLPGNARPGTYVVALKGRRNYLGQELPASKVIEFQVGSPERTHARLNTGGCKECHSADSALSRVNHALDNRSSCSTCHAPLNFELEGPIYVRLHFIHSRSARFDESKARCSTCHLDTASIARTSKSACLSCHQTYPESHVATYGPVRDMYVGGGPESFQNCTQACHTRHPGSGL
jgi:cytochrome c551/c552